MYTPIIAGCHFYLRFSVAHIPPYQEKRLGMLLKKMTTDKRYFEHIF